MSCSSEVCYTQDRSNEQKEMEPPLQPVAPFGTEFLPQNNFGFSFGETSYNASIVVNDEQTPINESKSHEEKKLREDNIDKTQVEEIEVSLTPAELLNKKIDRAVDIFINRYKTNMKN